MHPGCHMRASDVQGYQRSYGGHGALVRGSIRVKVLAVDWVSSTKVCTNA